MQPRYQYKAVSRTQLEGSPVGCPKFQRPRRKCGSDSNTRIGKPLSSKSIAISGKWKRMPLLSCVRRCVKLFSLEIDATNARLFVIFDTAQKTWRLEEFCEWSGVSYQRSMTGVHSQVVENEQ